MSLQHYIPAGFLGRFSTDAAIKPSRDRLLATIDLSKAEPAFQAKASSVGGINNLYKINDYHNDPQRLDRSWNSYESGLNTAINDLIAGTLDAVAWSRILVPFVTGLLVRGPEFDVRYTVRPIVAAISKVVDDPNQVNMARIFEMQRLLGPILAGEWFIAKSSGKTPLITSDVGFIPFAYQPLNKSGVAIPLDQRHILVVVARTKGKVLVKHDGIWCPIVCPVDLVDADIDGINVSVAKCARRFLYGGGAADIEKYRSSFQPSDLAVMEPALMGFSSGLNGRNHEFTWHRLISFLYQPQEISNGNDFPIDWAALDDDNYWSPLMMVPLEARPFCPASIVREDNAISIDLSEVPGASRKPVQSYIERTWSGPGTLYTDVHPEPEAIV